LQALVAQFAGVQPSRAAKRTYKADPPPQAQAQYPQPQQPHQQQPAPAPPQQQQQQQLQQQRSRTPQRTSEPASDLEQADAAFVLYLFAYGYTVTHPRDGGTIQEVFPYDQTATELLKDIDAGVGSTFLRAAFASDYLTPASRALADFHDACQTSPPYG